VVNGDIGEIVDMSQSKILVRFHFPPRLCELNRDDHKLNLAYALTVHKMQGSECPVIILPLSREIAQTPIWTRELVYTAFSRAKTLLITVGDLKQLRPALAKVSTGVRQTILQDWRVDNADGRKTEGVGPEDGGAVLPDEGAKPDAAEGSGGGP